MPKATKAGKRINTVARQPEAVPGAEAAASAPLRPLYKHKEMSARTRTISLVVGDIICFLIFATLGSNAHGKGVNLLSSLWIAVPFVVAWLLVAPWVGAFRQDITSRPRLMVKRVALAWLATWPIAMLLRWLLVERVAVPSVTAGAFFSFSLVTLIFNLGLLLLWRWPFAMNNSLRQRGL